MPRTLSSEVGEQIGETVTVKGWLHAVRSLGGVVFAVVRDRSGLVQCVTENPADADLLRGIGVESVMAVSGRVAQEPRAPDGVEIRIEAIDLISPVGDALPVQINKAELTAGLETLLDHRAISLRAPRARGIFRVQHEIALSFAEFLTGEGFTRIHTPKLVSAAAEGGAGLFEVDYFGRPIYLAQSPQLYKQIMVGVYERVFEVGPAFRAEKHDTARHTNEFTSLDLEMGFIDSHEDVMAMENAWLCHLAERLRSRCSEEFQALGAHVPHVPERIARVPLAEAQAAIGRCEGEPDLDPEGERLASGWAATEFGSEWLFVTHYGAEKRPFYTMDDPEKPGLTRSFDLLFRGWEVTTGGQRLHRVTDYERKLRAAGSDPSAYESYLAAFRYGMPPHGGLGAGLERLTARLLNLPNLRDATLFPRDRKRVHP
jgi:nondiscriminating aspartyl-tRNA synthetase